MSHDALGRQTPRRVARAFQTRPAFGLGLTALLAALALGTLVGRTLFLHPGRTAVGLNPASDFQIMTWSLAWWPWAIGHGVDPLHTNLLWPPSGFSTLWMTTIPVPALLALPVTLTLGPLVAYNALILLAVPLAAAAAYLLCWELTHRFGASLLGGLIFGLSPYMLGHTLSQHLDLTFVFPLPLLALLVVRRARGLIRSIHFVIAFTALLLLQLGASFELFLDLTLVVIVGVVLSLLTVRRRAEALRMSALIAASYAACLPVLVPIAVLVLGSPHAPLRYAPRNYATDVLNLVVPTAMLAAGGFHTARAFSQHFVGNVGEQDGYLGLPLLVVVALAARAEWRRGAWLIAALFAASLVLSFGPELTANGRPIVELPFAPAHLPLLQNLLPARFSVFCALAAACLCASWLAHHRRAVFQVPVAALLVVSLLPNFSPPHRMLRAWSISDALGWSTPHVASGFLSGRSWRRLIPPGSNVLVLPTGDRTDASYWQVRSGMRFALAMPATPFVPPRRAAAPIVRALTNDHPPSLASARLRAFIRSDRIDAVVVTGAATHRWTRDVAAATNTKPIAMGAGGTRVYRVPSALPPLVVRGPTLKSARRLQTPLVSSAYRRVELKAWLAFDGFRAHLRARLQNGPTRTLSGPYGNADMPATAIDGQGDAAVIFTEWNGGKLRLKVATASEATWRVATLDVTKQPIWSPRVVIDSSGTTVAAWIDETDPTRSIRAAVLPRGGCWSRPVTIENGDGLGRFALATGHDDLAVLSWADAIDTESRVRAAIFVNGRWTPVATLARSLSLLERVTIRGADASLVRWRVVSLSGAVEGRGTASRRGTRWRGRHEASPPSTRRREAGGSRRS